MVLYLICKFTIRGMTNYLCENYNIIYKKRHKIRLSLNLFSLANICEQLFTLYPQQVVVVIIDNVENYEVISSIFI